MIDSTPGRLPVIRFSDDADNDSVRNILNGHIFEFVLENGERLTGEVKSMESNQWGDHLLIEEWDTGKFHAIQMDRIKVAIYI